MKREHIVVSRKTKKQLEKIKKYNGFHNLDEVTKYLLNCEETIRYQKIGE